MPGIDPAAGMLAVPIWAAGAVAALLVVLSVMAYGRLGQSGTAASVMRYAALFIGALLVLTIFDRWAVRDRAAERRALEARATELTARAIAPGSPLACLDAGAGDIVESSCEKAVFATPEKVAAAVSYVAARLRLLSDGLAYARAGDRAYESSLRGLRKAMAADRFGIVAHVLYTRAGCVVDRCAAFTLVDDTRRIKLNLKNNTFAGLVARHSLAWSSGSSKELKQTPAEQTPPETAPSASVLPNLSFPSAASIPPVSIMNAEPQAETPAETQAPPAQAAVSPAKPPASPPRPARRARNNGDAPKPAPKPAPAAPMALTPPPTAFDTSAPTSAQ